MANLYSQRMDLIINHIIRGKEKVLEAVKNYQQMGDNYKEVNSQIINSAQKQIESKDKLSKKQKLANQKQIASQDALSNKQQFYIDWSKKLGVNTARVNDSMRHAGVTFSTTGRAVDLAGRKVTNLNEVMKIGEIKTRRFNMTMLSTMFAGMALQKSMSRLLRPAMEASGIFDIFGDILTTTFSPIIEVLTPLFEKLSDVMDKMGNTTKLIIGGIVLFLFVAGVMLAIGGQLGLAYGGLSVQIATLVVALNSASVSFAGMGATAVASGTTAQIAFAPFLPILYAIAAIVAMAIAIFYNWDEIVSGLGNTFKKFGVTSKLVLTSIALFFSWLGDRIKGFWDTITEVFTGIWDFIVDVWNSIGDWISEKWEWITEVFTWENIKLLLSALWNFFVSIWNSIWGVVFSVWNKILGFIIPIVSKIWNVIVIVFNAIWNTIKIVLNAIWETIKIIWNGIKETTKNVWNGIKETISNIFNGIKDFISNGLNWISTLFSNIWNGIKETTKSVWNGITGIIKGSINAIIGLINKLIGAWNSLSFKVPSISIPFLGTFGGQTMGVPQIPNIPTLGDGGIVAKPTLAMIGERGPEAVVPLNKGIGKGDINFSPTYNVTVSDKSDFEKMIKFNNSKMLEDLRRLIS